VGALHRLQNESSAGSDRFPTAPSLDRPYRDLSPSRWPLPAITATCPAGHRMRQGPHGAAAPAHGLTGNLHQPKPWPGSRGEPSCQVPEHRGGTTRPRHQSHEGKPRLPDRCREAELCHDCLSADAQTSAAGLPGTA